MRVHATGFNPFAATTAVHTIMLYNIIILYRRRHHHHGRAILYAGTKEAKTKQNSRVSCATRTRDIIIIIIDSEDLKLFSIRLPRKP